MPAIDDELAKDVGDFETLDDLKKDLEERVQQNMQQRLDDEFHGRLIEELIENNDLDLPDGMIDNYLGHMLEEAKKSPMTQSIDDETLRNLYRPSAVRNIKHRLMFDKLADVHNIEVGDEDIKNFVEEFAEKQKQDFERIWNRVKNDEKQKNQIRFDLREKKIYGFLAERQKVKEKKVDRKELEKRQAAQQEQ